MKLGLDIHGVIDKNPELFINFAKLYNEVHIITGGNSSDQFNSKNIEEELLELSNGVVFWHKIFSIHNHLIKIKTPTNKDLGIESKYPFPDDVWYKAKSIYCMENKIDLHIDDMYDYLKHFQTPYMLYKGC